VKYAEAVRQFKRNYWILLLARHGQNITQAAREAGMRRTSVYPILHDLGLPVRAPKRGKWGDLTD
jgi:DNA-binding NtrC family response regulator